MHGLSEKESKGSFISLVLRFSSLHSSCNVSAPRGSTWGMSVSFSSAGASRSVSMFSPCEDGWSLKWKYDENNDMLKLYGIEYQWPSMLKKYGKKLRFVWLHYVFRYNRIRLIFIIRNTFFWEICHCL